MLSMLLHASPTEPGLTLPARSRWADGRGRMLNPCFGLEPLPAGTPSPSCGATGFLCSHCRRTCGFCSVASVGSCIDKLPPVECAAHRSIAVDKRRRGNTSLGHGYCGVLPSEPAPPRWAVDPFTLDFVNRARRPRRVRARRCLAGRRVVFIGDSNTRYQYLSLAMALSSGAYPVQPRGRGFNICHEDSAKGHRRLNQSDALKDKWMGFWNQSSALLGGAEVCECTIRRTAIHENRWYDDGAAQLAYFKEGTPKIHSLPNVVAQWKDETGGFDAVRAAAATACLPPSSCAGNKSVVVTSSFAELAEHLARILRPGDVLVFSPGPWFSPDPKLADELRAFMRSIAAHLGPTGKAIFKTCARGSVLFTGESSRETRGCGNGVGCDATWRTVIPDTGWALLDAFAMTDDLWRLGGPLMANRSHFQDMQLHNLRGGNQRSVDTIYTDNFHFRCGIYAELNEQLLDLVCPAPAAAVAAAAVAAAAATVQVEEALQLP